MKILDRTGISREARLSQAALEQMLWQRLWQMFLQSFWLRMGQ
jgi:hypothetical protein